MRSSQQPGKLRLAGRDLDELLRGDLSELVALVLTSLAEQLDVYAALPGEALRGDIADTVERNLRLFISGLDDDASSQPAFLEEIRHSAARRAEERVPLDVMLRAYPLGARVLYEAVVADAGPDDVDALKAAASRLLDHLGTVIAAAASGYLEEHQMIAVAATSEEERLLEALLEGRGDEAGAGPGGMALPDAVDVVTLAIATHADETAEGIDAAIAARRKLRRIRTELRRRCGDSALMSITPDGGLVILPAGAADGALLDAIGAAAGVAVTGAAATVEPAAVPAAVTETREVLELAGWLGLDPGLHRLGDVAVEYQLTRPGPARRALAGLVAPIGDHAELTATLVAFTRAGGNRREVALARGVHPNTIDNRMAKVRRLTGLDPTRAADAFQLRTALVAELAERASSARAVDHTP